MRRFLASILLISTFILPACAADQPASSPTPNPQPPAPSAFTPLFNGKDLTGWHPVNTAPSTFTVRDGMLITTGHPTGILRSDRMYENFIVEFDWRHMHHGGNSGFYIYSDPITAVGQPFTRAVEIQVIDGVSGTWYTSQGDVFPIHGATMKPDNPRKVAGMRAFPTEDRQLPSPQWNHFRVVANNGDISLAVNGKVVTTGHMASPRKGYLGIESEGSECHFKNMVIQELPSTGATPEQTAKPYEGFESQFIGLDLTGWKTTDEIKKHWTTDDWELHYDGNAPAEAQTLTLDKNLGDYELILDYKTKSDGAEIQIRNIPAATVKLPTTGDKWKRIHIKLANGNLYGPTDPNTSRNLTTEKDFHATGPLALHATAPTAFGNIYIKPLTWKPD